MNILLLTDYGKLSGHIKNITDKIAEKTGAKVFVLNVITTPSEMTKIDHVTLDMKCHENPDLYVQKRADALEHMEHFTKSMKSNHESFVYYGGILDTIADFVKEENIDMIAMGTIYARGMKNLFANTLIGSIVKSINLPVFSLKCNRDITSFNNILVTCDFHTDREYDFSIVKSIREAFGSKLHLIFSNFKGEDNEVFKVRMNAFSEKYDLKPDFVKIINAKYEEDGIMRYIEQYESASGEKIELLSIEKRRRSPLHKLFVKSRAVKFINQIRRPILTVLTN